MTPPAEDDPGLFPEPPRTLTDKPAPDDANSWQKYKRRVRRRIATGLHPLGYVPLHPEASRDPDLRTGGPRCGDCTHRNRYESSDYPKCFLPFTVGEKTTYPRVTRSATSDIAAWWPACHDFKREETDAREDNSDEPRNASDGG